MSWKHHRTIMVDHKQDAIVEVGDSGFIFRATLLGSACMAIGNTEAEAFGALADLLVEHARSIRAQSEQGAVKLTKPQLVVLRKLATDGPCSTARSTWGVYVGGTSAAALVRHKLARRVPRKWNGVTIVGEPEVEITDAGREALKRAEFRI